MIDVSFSCVYAVTYNEFLDNIVEVDLRINLAVASWIHSYFHNGS